MNPNHPPMPFGLSSSIHVHVAAEETIHQISKLVNLKPQDLKTLLSICPYNPQHCVPAPALFRHFLQCPSSPARPFACHAYFDEAGATGSDRRSEYCFDSDGNKFFYKDAPGVVLVASASRPLTCDDAISSLPPFLRVELGSDSKNAVLLPSMLWSLQREVDAWKEIPTGVSQAVLRAAQTLGRVRRVTILEWLLVDSPSHGIVLDVALASHIWSLLKLFLKAVRTAACTCYQQHICMNEEDGSYTKGSTKGGITNTGLDIETEKEVGQMLVEFSVLSDAGTWLADKLADLYGPVQSRAVVLGLLKLSLKTSGIFLSSSFMELAVEHIMKTSASEQISHGNEVDLVDGCKLSSNHEEDQSRMLGESGAAQKAKECSLETVDLEILDDSLGERQVEEAIAALQMRATFEKYIKAKTGLNNLSRPQLIQEHEVLVKRAADERAKRPNFHAVSEHDGLTWQRSQQQENKSKTKEELMAEERDYKRRRMSYRGKKLKRTPTQVLHDIIENHMAEIADAGGIGCFSKQPSGAPLPSFNPDIHLPSEHLPVQTTEELRKSSLPLPGFQHQSGNTRQDSRGSQDRGGYVQPPRLESHNRFPTELSHEVIRYDSDRSWHDSKGSSRTSDQHHGGSVRESSESRKHDGHDRWSPDQYSSGSYHREHDRGSKSDRWEDSLQDKKISYHRESAKDQKAYKQESWDRTVSSKSRHSSKRKDTH
ncbi:unnamed protein product [Sphagnum troendelagicum]|uniref:CHHC U11-48K-type domain-containing protein n=1 Tax=Sphagnum troendelagicum TaxID=128251 RepID=A0ABP0TB75_9BRYO